TSAVLIHAFLPGWVKETGYETMLKDIQTPGLKEKILKEMPRIRGEEIILNAPANGYLIGKSLKEFAQNRNLTIGESLLELMKITDFRATISYRNISFKKSVQSLIHERAIVVSKSAGKFLKLVEKEKIMPIEKAIYKITGLPAAKLGLKNRGLVREGYSADLVLFRDAEIREVLVNGKRTVKDGEFQNVLAGEILKS
ncbi:MAG: amidohydrolase family protein, partial [Patescibacteria group bacterium]